MSRLYRWIIFDSLHALFVLALSLVFSATASAQAPVRPGQPYAEAARCADPSVILCEDFDYPENFQASSSAVTWANPGLVRGAFGYIQGVEGRQLNPASMYPTQPAGSPGGGYVWAANWDPARGAQGNGATWGKLREPGGYYANGTAPTRDIYIRFQYYVTDNYAWPGDPRSDVYYFGSGGFPVDNKILFLFPPEGMDNPTGSAYDAGLLTTVVYDPSTNSRFTDALAVRYGDAGDNYKFFPLDAMANYSPQHLEYGPFQSLTLRNPGNGPQFGKIFRFNTNRWYTLELHYGLSSAPGAPDGTVEVWVDGVQIYSAHDLATCGGGAGDCSGLGAIYLGAYHNGADATRWNGQQLVDNLIVSRAYIGPPGTGAAGASATAPAAVCGAPAAPAPAVAAPAPAPAPVVVAPAPAPAAPASPWGPGGGYIQEGGNG